MADKKSLIEFPCHFPIKIIGKNSTVFAEEIRAITLKHFPDTPNSFIVSKESERANYLSMTVTVYVHSQEELDAFYLELTRHPDIKMVL